jgi:hypothetical protein
MWRFYTFIPLFRISSMQRAVFSLKRIPSFRFHRAFILSINSSISVMFIFSMAILYGFDAFGGGPHITAA